MTVSIAISTSLRVLFCGVVCPLLLWACPGSANEYRIAIPDNPGCHWVAPSETAQVAKPQMHTGYVVSLDANSLVLRPLQTSSKRNFVCPRKSIRYILFYPPVNPKSAKKLCESLSNELNRTDHVIFVNSDVIKGEVISLSDRLLVVSVGGKRITIPVGRVRAVVFAVPS